MTGPVVALIPARGGSKRLPNKNIRVLHGHPLLAYTIAAALDARLFDRVVVSTEDEVIANVARHYGAEVPFLRPTQMASDLSPDVEWVAHALQELQLHADSPFAFSILRPTSPLRLPETIRRAWVEFTGVPGDSLRAVELCSQHPGKMWIVDDEQKSMRPLLDDHGSNPPWHSSPYQSLPRIYVQNASLEIAWVRTVYETGTIAGTRVIPFITTGVEGFDVNDAGDWSRLEQLVEQDAALLPRVSAPHWKRR